MLVMTAGSIPAESNEPALLCLQLQNTAGYYDIYFKVVMPDGEVVIMSAIEYKRHVFDNPVQNSQQVCSLLCTTETAASAKLLSNALRGCQPKIFEDEQQFILALMAAPTGTCIPMLSTVPSNADSQLVYLAGRSAGHCSRHTQCRHRP